MDLKNNAVYQVVGPSGSGKTHFVCKLLQNEKMFESKFNKIYWHQGADGEAGLTPKEFCKLKNITVVKGFDKNWSKRLQKVDVIIVDDLYQEANKKVNLTIYSLK